MFISQLSNVQLIVLPVVHMRYFVYSVVKCPAVKMSTNTCHVANVDDPSRTIQRQIVYDLCFQNQLIPNDRELCGNIYGKVKLNQTTCLSGK